jgi:predicted metal-dependent peptidase
LAHEVLHCALAHHCRRGSRNPELWNDACDYAINPIVLENGFALPTGPLLSHDYKGLSAEEIYARLLRISNNGGAGASRTEPNAGRGRFGDVLDATDDSGTPASEGERTLQAHEWSVAAEQARRSAKMCGHGSDGIELLLEEARESKKDWRGILRDFIAATVPSDYRWTPPNRRYIASGLYLPSVHREGTGKIVIGVDTSGSIGAEELKQFAAEITAISDQAQPELIHVVYCDTQVKRTQEFGPSEPVSLEPQGGGGTDFRPVFDWVEENSIAPVCLLYLTDLECRYFPGMPPVYPVLWVTDSRRSAPFGETVKILAD